MQSIIEGGVHLYMDDRYGDEQEFRINDIGDLSTLGKSTCEEGRDNQLWQVIENESGDQSV